MAVQQIWPEGEQFTLEVNLPTQYGPLPVVITYTVPPFETVVDTWQNKDPKKAYPLFRQFIMAWDQQDKLTDDVLVAYLVKWPGSYEAIFAAWAEHMKIVLATNKQHLPTLSNAIN